MTYKRSARLRSNSFPISCLLSLVFLTPSNQILFALVWTDFYTSLPLAYQSDTSWYVSSRHSSLAAKIKLTSNFLLYSIKSQGNNVELVKFNKWKNPFEKKKSFSNCQKSPPRRRGTFSKASSDKSQNSIYFTTTALNQMVLQLRIL